MQQEGYEQSPIDPCVMWRIVGDKVWLLLIYVDDILVIADRVEIDRLRKRFTDEFTWITIDIGKKTYLFGNADMLRRRLRDSGCDPLH